MNGITFNQENHTYTNEEGKNLTSITQFMQIMGIAPKLDGIPEAVLKRAADYGTTIHKELENYIKHGEIGLSYAVDNFKKAIAEKSYTPVESEVMVYDELLAGTIDCIFRDINGNLVMCDFKTTLNLNKDNVAWQLSLYTYLWNKSVKKEKDKITRIELWHFDKNDDEKLKTYDLKFIDTKEIKKVIKCYINGEPYETAYELEETGLLKLIDIEKQKAKLNAQIKELDKQAEEVKENLVNEIKSHNSHHYENDSISITIVDPITTQKFDSTRFKKENAEIYNNYLKESTSKESIRITYKGDK